MPEPHRFRCTPHPTFYSAMGFVRTSPVPDQTPSVEICLPVIRLASGPLLSQERAFRRTKCRRPPGTKPHWLRYPRRCRPNPTGSGAVFWGDCPSPTGTVHPSRIFPHHGVCPNHTGSGANPIRKQMPETAWDEPHWLRHPLCRQNPTGSGAVLWGGLPEPHWFWCTLHEVFPHHGVCPNHTGSVQTPSVNNMSTGHSFSFQPPPSEGVGPSTERNAGDRLG